MFELTEAQAWVKRARELLKMGKLAAVEKEVLELQQGLLKFADQPEVQQKLAPELTRALRELGEALAVAADQDLDAEPSSKALEQGRFYKDFRGQLLMLRKSLVNVLKPEEASTLDLALELGDNHARLGQFDPALTLLQQAWHRAEAIRKEGREGGLVEVVDEEDVERLERQQQAHSAYLKAAETVVELMQKLDPLSRKEQLQCTVFGLMVKDSVAKDFYADALIVTQHWQGVLEAILKADQEGQGAERRERKRRQLETQRQTVEKLGQQGLETTIENIRKEVTKSRSTLIGIVREIKDWTEGQPHPLESQIGALEFEVERCLHGLRNQASGSEEEQQACARLLVKAEAALRVMQQKEQSARQMLQQAKDQFKEDLRPKRERLQAYLKEKDAVVDKQSLVVQKNLEAIKQNQLLASALEDSSGKKITTPLAKTTLDFYAQKVKLLEPMEAAGKKGTSKLKSDEAALLALARSIVRLNKANDDLGKTLVLAQQRLDTLTLERKNGRQPLDDDLEQDKRPLDIAWDVPADIVYGTPLDATQLNARLSANSGTIEYYCGSERIEPGKTVLSAGMGRTLKAVIAGSDRDAFRETPPKEVKINVLKAKVTVACAPDIEYHYGTPFGNELLAARISTELASDRDLARLLAGLVCQADGKPLNAKDTLDAKVYALTVRSPASADFEASPEVSLSLTVKPAQREIAWDGAAPTTFTFGDLLTAKQLNATVRITTNPPLTEKLAELSQALEYVDETGKELTVGARLPAGDARRITVRTKAHANCMQAAPKTQDFKVEKAVHALAVGAPDPIGAVVQANDLKNLRSKITLKPEGELQFFIGTVGLAIGAKVPAGKKRKLRVAAKAHDNYQPTADREVDVDVLGFDDKFDGAKQSGTALLNKQVHSTHLQAVNGLRQQIELLGAVPDEQKFAKVNELLQEIEEIEPKLVTWQGNVPTTASPTGEAKLLEVTIDETDNPSPTTKLKRKAKKTADKTTQMIKHGGLTLGDVSKLVPKGTPNIYTYSADYPDGFKYEWTTPSGVSIVVYGHGPTVDDEVPDTADSKQGNLVRVKIDGMYLRPNGTLAKNAKDATSHMALY